MMRRVFVLPLAAALFAGCGMFGDCGAFDFDVVEGPAIAQTTSTASDTLTVVFEPTPGVDVFETWVRLGAETPSSSGGTQAAVRFDVEYGDYGAETVPTFQAEAQGDTLVIPLRQGAPDAKALAAAACAPAPGGIAQPVCSPPSTFYRLFINSTHAPDGVRHVRYVVRYPHGYRALTPGAEPTASGGSPDAGGARGPHRARTARG